MSNLVLKFRTSGSLSSLCVQDYNGNSASGHLTTTACALRFLERALKRYRPRYSESVYPPLRQENLQKRFKTLPLEEKKRDTANGYEYVLH